MDKRRAKEIAASSDMVNVTYNGDPIYIESVNDTKNSATIHFLHDPQKKQEVSLASLIEH